MTRENLGFQLSFLVSLLIHAVLFTVVFFLPAGSRAPQVDVYRVKILEAPARPQARALDLQTDVISELELEAPSLSPEAPPLTAPETPQAAAPPEVPQAAPQPAPQAPTPGPGVTETPRVSAPPAPQAEGGIPVPPKPQEGAPAPPPPQEAAAPLPRLPEAPATETPETARPQPSAEAPTAPEAAAPPSPPQTSAEQEAAMEALREKVRSLSMQFEEARTAQPETSQGVQPPEPVGSPLSLRRYQEQIRQAVQANYTFPGGFPPDLHVRARVTISRDGTVQHAEILESSGNEQFDYAVLLTLRGAKLPPIPDEIEGETLVQTFQFTPDR
ncbi:MAG TPA: TonB family protein [Gammaproteobacteria bacterium]|nr:TonB family protein [Gammaproteobacteria bacterium]